MAGRVDVTFKMTAADLLFLKWAMEFIQGGPNDHDADAKEWEYQLRRALDDHFEDIEDEEG